LRRTFAAIFGLLTILGKRGGLQQRGGRKGGPRECFEWRGGGQPSAKKQEYRYHVKKKGRGGRKEEKGRSIWKGKAASHVGFLLYDNYESKGRIEDRK